MRKFLFTLALVLVSLSANAAVVGQPAPDFQVNDINGNPQSISQYKGKEIVLEWNNPGCPFVQKFYNVGEMQKLQSAAKNDGVIWLVVNSGAEGKQGYMTKDEAAKQAEDWKLQATGYIIDANGEVGRKYGATATPHMYVINKEGVLVYAGAIDNKPTAKSEDIASANNYVTAALKALKEGEAVEVATTKAYGCGVKYAE